VRPFGRIGPLAAWELRRLARRGLALRVRLAVLYALFVTFVVFTAAWFFPLPARDVFTAALPRMAPADVARFAGAFALALLEVQLVVVVALTPALAAAAVSEEKDRGTLPLLLTTLLTDREIVFGKAVGRGVFVLASALAGLPVLMLALPLGGIAVEFLMAGYALTAGTVVLCAAIGVSAACAAANLRAAALRAYGRTALLVCGAFVPPLVFVSPFGLLVYLHNEPDPAVVLATGCGYALAQAAVGAALLARAARGLRLREPGAGPPPRTAYPEPPRRIDPPFSRPDPVLVSDLPDLDDADPVLWKERHTGRSDRTLFGRAVAALAGALAVTFFGLGVWEVVQRVGTAFDHERAEELLRRRGLTDPGGWLLVCAGVFAGGRYLLPLAVAVSGAIAGERFRRTLDPLLVTALDRRALLRAKVQAHAERGAVFGAAAVAAVGMAFTADAGIRLGVAAAALVVGGFGFVVGLGAWLTVRSASDTRAFQLLFLFAVIAVGWPAGVWNLLRADTDVPPELVLYGLLGAAGVCAGAGPVLWWCAERNLERGE
jgi:ABC-type transport system involved in multi-copper enzyme maturation permease subunit